MHITVEFAIGLVARRHRAVMTRVANGIAAAVRLPARQAPGQVPESVEFLGPQAAVVAGAATAIGALAAEEVVVAELAVAQPGDDGFLGFDGRIDAVARGVAVDDGVGPGELGAVFGVAEDTLEGTLAERGEEAGQAFGAGGVLEDHQFLRGGFVFAEDGGGSIVEDVAAEDQFAVLV